MGPLQFLWHLLGFVAIPLLLAGTAAALARALWRRAYAAQGLGFGRLGLRCAAACIGAAGVALTVTGRDGTMAGYAGQMAACALTLWWPIRRG